MRRGDVIHQFKTLDFTYPLRAGTPPDVRYLQGNALIMALNRTPPTKVDGI